MPVPVPDGWQTLKAGQSAWYAFKYAGDRTDVLVRLSAGPAGSAKFAVWSPAVSIEDMHDARATGEVAVVQTGCNGFCACGPIMVVYPGGFFYQKLTPEDMPELVEEHVLKGQTGGTADVPPPVTQAVIPHYADIPFFARQNLRVLHNKGRISATSIEEYIGRGGYIATAKALLEMTPQGIIEEMKKSGLRGRGGAGFPTGMKWEFAAKPKSDQKYFLCNADEGDPGAFMDRSVLESDPHAVIEGMIIGARAIGASQGYIYCRAEYPLAIERLTLAIAPVPRARPPGQGHPRAPASTSTSTSPAARARSSAARRRP